MSFIKKFFKKKHPLEKIREELEESGKCGENEILNISNEELNKIYEKYGLKSSINLGIISYTLELMKRLWCISDFTRKVVKDLEEARSVSRETYEKLLLIYMYTIPVICRTDKKKDYFCKKYGKKIYDKVKLLVQYAGVREDREILEHDRRILKGLVAQYYIEMGKKPSGK